MTTYETQPTVDSELVEAIRRFVALSFRDGRTDGLTAETPLVTSGIVDSAGVLELVGWLEMRFGIQIEDEDVSAENFDSIGALARLVHELRS